MKTNSYFDIGANLTHESFDKDLITVIEEAKQNNVKNDIISENMNIFIEGLLPQLELVYSNRPKLLKYIDNAIKYLSKLRELYISDTNNIESAKNKLSQFKFENMIDNKNILPLKITNKNSQ